MHDCCIQIRRQPRRYTYIYRAPWLLAMWFMQCAHYQSRGGLTAIMAGFVDPHAYPAGLRNSVTSFIHARSPRYCGGYLNLPDRRHTIISKCCGNPGNGGWLWLIEACARGGRGYTCAACRQVLVCSLHTFK